MRRLPIYFLLDVSESMLGENLYRLEEGLQHIIGELRTDPHALETAWVSVIAFAGKAREVVRALWLPKLNGAPVGVPDAKSALQEWAQGQGLELPFYIEVAREGPDHAPRFTSEVRIKGRKPARGEGASKRAAEQAAAATLLAREGVWKQNATA